MWEQHAQKKRLESASQESQTTVMLNEVYYWVEGFLELSGTSYQDGWRWFLDSMVVDTCATSPFFQFLQKILSSVTLYMPMACQRHGLSLLYSALAGYFAACYQIWKQAWSLSTLCTDVKNQPNENVKFLVIYESFQLKVIWIVSPFVRELTRSFSIFAWNWLFEDYNIFILIMALIK